MAKWVIPKSFEGLEKIQDLMLEYNLSLDEVLLVIEDYANDKLFDIDLGLRPASTNERIDDGK